MKYPNPSMMLPNWKAQNNGLRRKPKFLLGVILLVWTGLGELGGLRKYTKKESEMNYP